MHLIRCCVNALAFCLFLNCAFGQSATTPPAGGSQPAGQPAAPPPVQPATIPAATLPTFFSWTASPSSLPSGSTGADVRLTAPRDECTASNFDASLQKATVQVQGGLGVTATSSKHSFTCEMTVTLKADSTVNQGSLRLTVMDGSTPPAEIGQATIALNSVAPGPVPPGLEPGVDATWQVEDYDVIKQNFGQNLSNHYLAILIKLGNNTGYNLLLDGVAFQTLSQPVPSCSASPNCPQMPNPIPSETPFLLQGVVAYGETYSTRNIALRSLQWASLLTTGFIPFFKAAGAAATYATSIALLNGPFTTGFTGMFPDLTVQQLQRLGGSGILANSNELDNNTSATYLAFLSRSSICSASKSNSTVAFDVAAACGGPKAKNMNPAQLTKYLAQLVVVGVKIPAANARFRVVTTAATATSTELTADKSVMAGVLTATTFSSPANSSLDLTNATVVQSAVAGVSISATTKTTVQANVTAHTTQQFTLQFLLKDGSTVSATVKVDLPTIKAEVQANTVTFSCTQCSATDASSDWSSVKLVWSDSKLTINNVPSSTGEYVMPSLTTSTPIKATAKGTYTVHLLPKNFASGDSGVTVQITIS